MNNPNIDESLAEKRNRLLANYAAMSGGQNEPMSESQFNAKLLSLNSAQLEEDGDDDRLLETAIRYALAYLEEFDYELKMLGVRMLERIVEQTRPTRLKLNMRADLIRDTLNRYVNDKEALDFLDKSNELMIKLLGTYLTIFRKLTILFFGPFKRFNIINKRRTIFHFQAFKIRKKRKYMIFEI